MIAEKQLRGEIAKALWTYYEFALPDTPYRMAVVIVKELKLKGLVKPDELVARLLCSLAAQKNNAISDSMPVLYRQRIWRIRAMRCRC